MIEITPMIISTLLAGTVGGLLGMAFFVGLWVTVSCLPRSPHPALWMLGSLVLRLGFVLIGFYYIIFYGGVMAALTATLGFLGARFLAVRIFGGRIFGEHQLEDGRR